MAAAKIVTQPPEKRRTQRHIVDRILGEARCRSGHADLPSLFGGGCRQQLHEPLRIGAGGNGLIELAFLPGDRMDHRPAVFEAGRQVEHREGRVEQRQFAIVARLIARVLGAFGEAAHEQPLSASVTQIAQRETGAHQRFGAEGARHVGADGSRFGAFDG